MQTLPGLSSDPSVSEIKRVLGIHRQVAWQVQRLAVSQYPLGEAGNVPSPKGMDAVVQGAFGNRGAERVVAELSRAYSQYQDLVKRHADNAETLTAMIASLTKDDAVAISERDRRTYFRSLSKILGMRARLRLGLFVLSPSPGSSDRVDIASANVYHGMWQLRAGVQWPISRRRAAATDARYSDALKPNEAPIDREGVVAPGLHLLKKFTTVTPEQISKVSVAGGRDYYCTLNTLGKPGEQNCAYGGVQREVVPVYAPSNDPTDRASAVVITQVPCESVTVDVLIHEDLPWTSQPESRVYADHLGAYALGESRPDQPLPIGDEVVSLGPTPGCLRLPTYPDYEKLVEYVVQSQNVDVSQFRTYRCSVAFPVAPSRVLVSWHLPLKP